MIRAVVDWSDVRDVDMTPIRVGDDVALASFAHAWRGEVLALLNRTQVRVRWNNRIVQNADAADLLVVQRRGR